MTAKKPASEGQIDKTEEARNLAHEAVEEMAHGDREEGKFLAEEAKALDPSGAAEVLKNEAGQKPKKAGG